jgi:cystathionine beta-lyase
MGLYNFDKIVDRKGTGALKLELRQKAFGRTDLLPLWIADMDFETPAFIIDAMRKRLEHPIFGYTAMPNEYWETVINWIYARHGWTIKREWMSFIPGIVKGIGMVVNVFVRPEEKVIIQPPVYHPFRLVPQGNNRTVVYNPLHENEDGTYSMDFENLAQVADEKCKLLILSNPHNPAGIVWDKDTLQKLAKFCYDRHILVISDEIHCDMALFGNKHIPFGSVSEESAACSITFGAPTKTFNMAGIVSSYAIVPNPEIRKRFFGWLEANEMGDPTLFAPIATIAAFKYGEEWREEMLHYVEGNVEFVEKFCKEKLPQIHPVRPQASFLIWLDCRVLNLSHAALDELFVDGARLGLNDGEMFGKEGHGFMRLNVGAPRTVIAQAMEQLKQAVDKLPVDNN